MNGEGENMSGEEAAAGSETTESSHIAFEAPVGGSDEASRLRELDAQVRDQDDLERGIGREADRLLFEQAQQRDQQRLEKSKAQKGKITEPDQKD